MVEKNTLFVDTGDKDLIMLEKLKSRKLWVSLGGVASVLFGAFNGSIPWDGALPSIAAIIIGYCVSQGWVDAKAIQVAAQSASEVSVEPKKEDS